MNYAAMSEATLSRDFEAKIGASGHLTAATAPRDTESSRLLDRTTAMLSVLDDLSVQISMAADRLHGPVPTAADEAQMTRTPPSNLLEALEWHNARLSNTLAVLKLSAERLTAIV
jgi:hypothetical protein